MRLAISAACILALAACDRPTSIVAAVGTFDLVTVDGVGVPARGSTAIVVRGALSLGDRGAYTLTQTDSALSGGGVTGIVSEGFYDLTDNSLTLHEGNTIHLGLVSGNADSVRVLFRGGTNVYVRR